MSIISYSLLLTVLSFLAGLLGSLTGLGGGVIIIAVLVMLFHINIHYAMGAALISVITTSSGTAVVFMRAGYTNLRIGMFLEVAAVIGAIAGALLIPVIPIKWLTMIFSGLLSFSAYLTLRRRNKHPEHIISHPWATALSFDTHYPVLQIPLAFFLTGFAGMLSGLLGIGSGVLNVVILDQIMRIPYKVATTTSNFMIGITAAVSAGIYFSHNYIQPEICFPVVLGVVAGSFTGAGIMPYINTGLLRVIFSIMITLIAIQMLYNVWWTY